MPCRVPLSHPPTTVSLSAGPAWQQGAGVRPHFFSGACPRGTYRHIQVVLCSAGATGLTVALGKENAAAAYLMEQGRPPPPREVVPEKTCSLHGCMVCDCSRTFILLALRCLRSLQGSGSSSRPWKPLGGGSVHGPPMGPLFLFPTSRSRALAPGEDYVAEGGHAPRKRCQNASAGVCVRWRVGLWTRFEKIPRQAASCLWGSGCLVFIGHVHCPESSVVVTKL